MDRCDDIWQIGMQEVLANSDLRQAAAEANLHSTQTVVESEADLVAG